MFFLLWCAIPGVMLVAMVRQVAADARTWSWNAAECTVVDSGVREVDPEGRYAFTVRYAYAAGPVSAVEAPKREGATYSTGYRGGPDYADALRLSLRFAPGSRATCYVDPDDPSRAVLKREVPWLAFMLPLPLLFVAIGVGGLWFTWRGDRGEKDKAAAPISSGEPAGRSSVRGAWFAVAFFGIFLAVGLVVAVFMGGKAVKLFAARSWTPVPATVLSSDVRTHSGDSTTYSVNILFAYAVDGREYRSNRYTFMGGSSSGYDGKRQVVRRYPPGTKFTAYVNPADPVDAVIERGWTLDVLILLVPLAFVAVGGVGVYFSARHARRLAGATGNAALALAADRITPRGRYVVPSRPVRGAGPGDRSRTLKPQHTPGVKLVGVSVIALFWNGVVSVFVYHVVRGWAGGRGEVCPTLFLLPFLAVGIGLIVGVFHSLLALFNPRCELTIDPGEVALGQPVEFRWAFNGRYDRIHRLVLRVEGREEATYRQGTNTHTDKNVFYVSELTDTSRAVDVHRGKAKWTVPADTMHSFTAPNNKIVWVLHLHGHIHGWPDVKDEYVLTVAPLPAGTQAPAAPDNEDDGAPRLAAPLAGRVSGSDEESAPQAGRLTGEVSRWT